MLRPPQLRWRGGSSIGNPSSFAFLASQIRQVVTKRGACYGPDREHLEHEPAGEFAAQCVVVNRTKYRNASRADSCGRDLGMGTGKATSAYVSITLRTWSSVQPTSSIALRISGLPRPLN